MKLSVFTLSFFAAICQAESVVTSKGDLWLDCDSNPMRICVDRTRQYDPNVGMLPSCVGSEFDKDTTVSIWNAIAKVDVLDAVLMARSFLRYKVSPRLNSKESKAVFLDPTRDFSDYVPPQFWTAGVCSTNLSVALLPFKVENPISKNTCYTCLVRFLGPNGFCLAVYVNMNTGEAGLDFRSISGCPFLVSRISAFPFLTKNEFLSQYKFISTIAHRKNSTVKARRKDSDAIRDVDVEFDEQ